MLRAVQSNKVGERANRCQALITRCNPTLRLQFQCQQELAYPFGGKVSDGKLVDWLAGLSRHEGEQLTECVTIAVLSISRQIADAYQMFQQEAPHPGAELRVVSHWTPPLNAYCSKRRLARSSSSGVIVK